MVGGGLLALAAAAAVIAGVLFGVGAPPREVTLATGPAGSAYAAIAEQYRSILARSGITLKLLPTAGDAENLARLRDPGSGVSAAFAISGLPEAEGATGIESLGTIAYEPLWIFERAARRGLFVEGFAGRRVSLDVAGSGTQALVERLFRVTGLSARGADVLHLPPTEAADRLLAGDLDVVALVADGHSPVVRRLAADPRISIGSFRRPGALVALNPDLTRLTLPAGIADFNANLPPEDVTLIAPKASLLVRADLHNAIQYLLLDAASAVHARPGIFHAAGAFPAAESIEFPLSSEATRYYKSGRPFLQRHLPFWAAVLAQRLLVLLLPLIGIIVPASNAVRNGYKRFMERRILTLYGELRLIEQEVHAGGPGVNYEELMRRLDAIEERAAQVRVPVRFAQVLYTLRDHVRAVESRLGHLEASRQDAEERGQASTPPGSRRAGSRSVPG